MFCIQCGTELNEGTKFCTKCGADQNPVPAQPQVQQAVQPVQIQQPAPQAQALQQPQQLQQQPQPAPQVAQVQAQPAPSPVPQAAPVQPQPQPQQFQPQPDLQQGQPVQPPKKKRSKAKIIIPVILVLILLLAGAFFVWKLFVKQSVSVGVTLDGGDSASHSPAAIQAEGTNFFGQGVSESFTTTGASVDLELIQGEWTVSLSGPVATDDGTLFVPKSDQVTVKVSDFGTEISSASKSTVNYEKVEPVDVTDEQISQLEQSLRDAGADESEVVRYRDAVSKARDEAIEIRDAWVGTWNLYEMEQDGERTTNRQLKTLEENDLSVDLVLESDGTLSLNLFGEKIEGTWSAESTEQGSAEMEGQAIDMSMSKSKLVLEEDDASLTFERDDSMSKSSNKA